MTLPLHHQGQRSAHHLPYWQRRLVFGAGATLLLSGAAWLVLHCAIGQGPDELPQPLEAWLMRLHGLAAFAGLFALGMVAASHLPHGWHLSGRRRFAHQRGSGLLLCALALLLAGTGYLLYYFSPETVRPTLGWVHSASGMAMAVAMLLHRRSRPSPLA